MLARTEELFVLIACFEQTVNVLGGVLHAVLVQHTGAARKAQAGKAIILRDDDIPRPYSVDQRKIHAVGTLIEDLCIRAVPLDAVGGIAEDQHGDFVRFADSDREIDDGTAVGVYENSGHFVLPPIWAQYVSPCLPGCVREGIPFLGDSRVYKIHSEKNPGFIVKRRKRCAGAKKTKKSGRGTCFVPAYYEGK